MPSTNTFSTADSNYDGPLNSKAILLRTVGDVQKIHHFTETILYPILFSNVISLECIDAIQALETLFSSKNIADTDTTQMVEKAVETFICNTFTWKFPSNLNPLKIEEYSSSIFRSLIRTFNVPLKILVDLVRRLDDPTTTLDDIPLIKGLISSFIDGLLDKKDHSSLIPSVLIDEILLKSPLFDIYSLLAEHADDPFISDTTTTNTNYPQQPQPPPLESILSEHFDLSIKLHHLLSMCPMSSSSQRQNLLMSALQHLVKSPTTERYVVRITINLLSFTDHHSYLLDFLSASLECFESWSNLAPLLIPLLLNLRQTLHDKQDLHRLVLIIKELLLELSKKECLGVGIGIGTGGFVVSDGDKDPLEIIKELSHPLGLLLGDLHSRHDDRLFVDGFISGLAVDFPLPTPKKAPTTGSGNNGGSGSSNNNNRNPLHSCLPVLLGSIGCSSPTTLLSLCVIGIKNQLSNRKLDGLKDFLPPPTPPLPASSSITALPNFISIFSKKEKKERSTPGSPLSLLHLTEASTHQFLLQLSLMTPVAVGRSFDDCLEIISLLLKDLHHNVDPLLKEMIVRRKKDHHNHNNQKKNNDNDNDSILPQPLPITITLLQVLGCLGSLSRRLMQLESSSNYIKKLHIFLLDLFIERSLFFLELGRIHKHAMGMVFNGSSVNGNAAAAATPNRYSPLVELDLLVAMIASTVGNTKTTYSDDETQHFQEFWLLFSYVGYISTSSANRFRPAFSRHLCAISTGTPLLLRNARTTTSNPNTNNARNFSTILLEGEGEQQEHLQVLRTQLSRMLGTKEKTLSLPQCLWLISISLCESGRREMDYAIIQTYLTDASLDRLGLADRVELLMSNLILERGSFGGGFSDGNIGSNGNNGGRMSSSAISKMLLGLLGHNNMRAHRCAVSVIKKLTLPVDPVIWDLLFEKLVLLWMWGRRPLLSTTTTSTSSTSNLTSTTSLVRELQGATEAFRDVRRIAKDVWTMASRKSPLKFFRWASKTINDPSFKGAGGDRNIGCLEIFRIVLGDDIGVSGGNGSNHSADTDDLRHLQTMPFSNNEDYFMLSNGGSDHISMIRARIDSVEDGMSSIEDLLPLLSATATTPTTTVEILGTKTLIFNYFIESLNDPAKREDNIQVSLKIFKSASQLASIKSIEYLTELVNHPSYAVMGGGDGGNGGSASLLERSYFRYVEEYLRSIKRFQFDKETFSLFQHCEIKCLDRIIELMEMSLLFLLFGRTDASSTKGNKIPLYDKKTKSGRRISLLYAFIHIFGREREDRQVFLTESAINQKHSQTTPSSPPTQTLLNDLSLISLDLARLLWERGNMKTGSFAKEAWRFSAMQFLCNPSLITFIIEVGMQSISTIPEILFIIAFCPSIKDCLAISCLSKHSATPPSASLLEVAIKNLSLRSLMSSCTKKLLIPQLVQILRFNVALGTNLLQVLAKGDSGFAHQLIWNMRANQYTDDEGRKEDPVLAQVLENIIKGIVSSFTKVELSFYEEEFRFFSRVTQISSTIKPLLKKEKWEKKKKIDEELEKIEVQAMKGLYLPSNPECVVKAIKYGSGRPLQSHAKTPFMASFLVLQNDGGCIETTTRRTTEQAVIFKVGDDCRQDVLALQLISLAKEILGDEGLGVYLFPYRVVATGPGQGVIEVIPNSISRDQLGREKINSLYDYFVYNFGDSPQSFHQARCNYVRSMAAYSVVCYLFAIKDRHNGNIMLDDEGHVVHIDFGFILDIGPGGVFENAPFKLTSEMLQLMGGKDDDSQYFWWFRELCVQTFLLLRTRSSEFINLLEPMIASGLPCFTKGLDPVSNKTIKNMRARFRLDLDSSGARQYMYDLVYHSSENVRTALYDKYQLSSNGIPY